MIASDQPKRINVTEARRRFEEHLLPKLLAKAAPDRRDALERRLRERFEQYLFHLRLEVLLEREFGEGDG